MIGITIRQPWVERILAGTKREEFRSWPTAHRGLLVLHAGASRVDMVACTPEEQALELPRGYIVGLVAVAGCHWDRARGCHAWELSQPRRLPVPIACPGKLKLWTVPPGIEAAILAQLEDLEPVQVGE